MLRHFAEALISRPGLAAAIADRPRQAARLRGGLGLRRRAARRAGRCRGQPDLLRAARKVGRPPRTTASGGGGCLETMVEWKPALRNDERMIRAEFLGIAVRRADDGSIRPDAAAAGRRGDDAAEKQTQNRHLGARHARRRRNDRPAGHRHQAVQAAGRAQLHQALSAGRRRLGRKNARRSASAWTPFAAWRSSSRIAGNIRGRPSIGGWRSSAPPATTRTQFKQRLDQIVGNWGQFEAGDVAAGRPRGDGRLPLPQRQAASSSPPTKSTSPSCWPT